MKLYFSSASPFVRKVRVVALELGVLDRIEMLKSAAHPVNRDRTLVGDNPLGQVPTLITDDGTALYDSPVICEYLDGVAGGRLFPEIGPARWGALTEQALADGLLGAGILVRYEDGVRPEPLRWADWRAGQMDKIKCALDVIESKAAGFGNRVDIGTISIGCALGWLDFRFEPLGWRNGRAATAAWYEGFRQRPSMTATVPTA